MNPQPNITDAVGLAIIIIGYVFPREAAAIFGPYLVIVAAATLGASWATIRRTPGGRVDAIFFFVRVVGLALLVSVTAAQLLSAYYEAVTVRASLAGVAFAVGIVGDDWPSVLRWAASKAFGAITRRATKDGDR